MPRMLQNAACLQVIQKTRDIGKAVINRLRVGTGMQSIDAVSGFELPQCLQCWILVIEKFYKDRFKFFSLGRGA